MYSASDYRGMARRALKNYWWLAVGVTLLASILGGTSSSFTPSFSLTINGDDLTQYYPEALRHALQVFLPVSGVISLVQFVIGYLWLTPYMTVSRAAFYRSLPRSMGDRAPNGWQPNPGPQPGGDWYSQN